MFRRSLPSSVSWLDDSELLEDDDGGAFNCLFCWGNSTKEETVGREETVNRKGLIKFNTGSFIQNNFTSSFYDEYEVGEMIGSGAYGEVYECYRRENHGSERAVKIVPKSDKDKDNESVVNEFNIIKGLDHPNIIKVYELFHDAKNYYIVTEIYRGGELFDEINHHGPLNEDDAALLIMNVLTCVNYCHKENLVHGDLKVENILLDDNLKFEDIKIIDFGLSFICNPNETPSEHFSDKEISELIRTPAYQAPEVIDGIVGPKSDVWSVGVITFVVLGGYTPFRGDSVEQILEKVLEGNVSFDYDVWDLVSTRAKDFICYLLEPEEDERPTAEEALQHPWLRARKQKLKKEFKATKRQSAVYSLGKLKNFQAKSKLKQATSAFIAAQLLTKDERDEIDDIFRVLDEGCDGKLDAKDLQEAFKQYNGDKLSVEEVEKLVAQVDVDKTGYIEYSEFLVASMSRRNLFDDNRVETAFRNFDKDHDGVIDMKDLRTALSLDKKLDGAVKKIVREADADGDGKITLTEFKSVLMQENS